MPSRPILISCSLCPVIAPSHHGRCVVEDESDGEQEENSEEEYAQSEEAKEENDEAKNEDDDGEGDGDDDEDEDDSGDDMDIDPNIQFVVNMRDPARYTYLRHYDQFRRPNDSDDPRFHTLLQKAVFEKVYKPDRPFAGHKWISWKDINRTPEIVGLQ